MTGVVVNPTHAHGFDRFENRDGQVRAYCVCGSWWTGATKPEANRLLGKHLRERAREFRKVRNALRQQGINGGQSKEVPQ